MLYENRDRQRQADGAYLAGGQLPLNASDRDGKKEKSVKNTVRRVRCVRNSDASDDLDDDLLILSVRPHFPEHRARKKQIKDCKTEKERYDAAFHADFHACRPLFITSPGAAPACDQY